MSVRPTGRRARGARASCAGSPNTRMAHLMRITSLATQVLESEPHAREWLNRPLRELGGHTPLQMATTEPGALEVERVLGRLEHGIFA